MSSLDAKVMPFGKYKGKRIDAIAAGDPGWLRWLLEMSVYINLPVELYGYIREALRRRGQLSE